MAQGPAPPRGTTRGVQVAGIATVAAAAGGETLLRRGHRRARQHRAPRAARAAVAAEAAGPVADATGDPGAEGRPGRAVLLRIADAGGTFNDDPSVVLTVRVHPDDGESPVFETKFSDRVSRVAVPRPGDTCPVRYDPEVATRIVRTGDFAAPGPGAASPVEVVQALDTLDGLRRSGALTEAEFRAQKARLLAG